MPTPTIDKLLDQLDVVKTQFTLTSTFHLAKLLKRLAGLTISDAEQLIRLHELLLFVRAHPHNTSILKQADSALRSFPDRISRLQKLDVDLSALEHPEVSGIAGMAVTDTFGYHIVQWLKSSRISQVELEWDWFEDENRLAEVWPRFMSLLGEDALVEANVPYREWLRHARGKKKELVWLMERFSQLKVSESRKAEIYNSQKSYLRWRFGYGDSRTGLRVRTEKLFYHDGPMIQRRDVRFFEELSKPARKLKKLSTVDGHHAIDMARAASTVRYRELYGFTHGDPKSVYRTSIGRGVELFILTLPPEKRLPLRAYHSVMIYKNGVPIGYFEGLSLCERMESGFNLYYTFRDGETAWLYAQVLHLMRHLTGVTSFTLDPYQIGFENEEGIESGAFWFYRKLGFRSTRKSIQKLTEGEEKKIKTRKNYRTSAASLRQLAVAPMILELEKTGRGDWDRFQVRNIGFAVQCLMAQKFGGDANRMRTKAVRSIAALLGVVDLSPTQGETFADFAVVLLLVPGISRWSDDDKQLLTRVILAKTNGDEGNYLRLMQRHRPLREALIRLGSGR